MSDPLSTNPVRAAEPHDEADREARIEELLLSGLDHYFGGQYERAISVWTRIVFLDRHHDRARAYIERARSALAERQRESEECLHDGVVAYNAGEIDKARDLLTRAVEQGSDAARVFLDRLNRVGPVRTECRCASRSEARARRGRTPPDATRAAPPRMGGGWARRARRRGDDAAEWTADRYLAVRVGSGGATRVRFSPPWTSRCRSSARRRRRCCAPARCTPMVNCTTRCARSIASASGIPFAPTPTGFEPTSSAISSLWRAFPPL